MPSLPISSIRLSIGLLVGSFLHGVIVGLTGLLSQIILLGVLPIAAGFLGLGLLEQKRVFIFVSICMLGLLVGFFRGVSVLPAVNPLFETQVGEEILVSGIVADEPDERETSIRLTIELSTGEKVLAIVPLSSNVRYGDRVEVRGRLDKPKNFSTDTGREFDYIHYLQARGISYILANARIEKQQTPEGLSVYRSLFVLKQKFIDGLESSLPEPQASLGAGLVVGARRGLGEEWTNLFRQAGVIHIVVLSGYNITIVAQSLLRATGSFLPRLASFSLAGVSIIMFAMLVGGGATVVRASIMALLALLAQATGRRGSVGFALVLAAFLMVLHNPLILLYDTGFQLSFLATLGLIFGSPLVSFYLTRVPERFGLREIVSSTIATQVFVLPWLLYKIGELSIVALPVNFLVLPVVPLSMVLVAVAGVAGLVTSGIGLLAALPATIVLSYILTVVSWSTALSWAAVPVASFSWWWLVIAYSVYGYAWYVFSTRQSKIKSLQ